MKKYIEDEIIRGGLIALLGVMMLVVAGQLAPDWIGYGRWFYLHEIVLTILVVLGIADFALIMRSAGHYRGKEEVAPNYFDKFPLEVYIFFDGLVFLVGIFIYMGFYTWVETLALLGLGVCYLSRIFFCMSFAVRCKTGTLLKNTLVYRSFDGVKNFVVSIINSVFLYLENIPLYYQIPAVVVVAVIFYLSGGWGVVIATIVTAASLLYLCRLSIAYRNIKTGIEKIAGGDTAYQIETKNMPKTMKGQAENLNGINAVVSGAIQQRIKSEQFKTELITNVSHDIKTPLTSIINYIDLIKKEDVSVQPMADYVAVLDRQSARLKKLIEDLVEASKASTGNITVNLAVTDLNILLAQAVGEYGEKAENRKLEFAVTLPEKERHALSDGRLLWRVFDNLLNNACKYSQPGTRVYIDLAQNDGKAVITFKNISKVQLNITPDELMERFVRGDSSRNTEGSGLGLSIARSLTEILGGEMKLDIDGDMFKAMLTFDLV